MSLCVGVTLLGLLLVPVASAAKAPILSLRVLPSGAEAELHLGSLGVMYIVGKAGEPGCSNLPDHESIYGARYFFGGPQDSIYLGALAYSGRTVAGCVVVSEQAVAVPIVGYHWLWDSGFNVDVGLRPGAVAAGFSF